MSLTAVPLSYPCSLPCRFLHLSHSSSDIKREHEFYFFLLWLTRCLSTLDATRRIEREFLFAFYVSTANATTTQKKKHVDPSPEQIVIIIKISSLLSSFASFISQQELQTGEIELERETRVRKSKIQKCLRMIREFAIKLFIRLQREMSDT